MRRVTTFVGCLFVAMVTFAMGCDSTANPAAVTVRVGASVSVAQTPLDGTTIPKYVDPVPTFNGRRVDGTAAVTVNMEEFQQKVLPASVYAPLPAPYNAGTFLWGYNINSAAPSCPARTIEAKQDAPRPRSTPTAWRNTQLQKLLTVDPASTGPIRSGRSPPTTASTARRCRPRACSSTPGRSRRSSTCTAPRSCRNSTASRRLVHAAAWPKRGQRSSATSTTIRTRRKRRRCGSTTTRWASFARTSTLGSPASISFATPRHGRSRATR